MDSQLHAANSAVHDMKPVRETFIVLRPLLWAFVIIAILLGLVNALARQPEPLQDWYAPPCADNSDASHIRALAKEALDKWFKEHARRIYDVMLSSQQDQPNRAIRGMRPSVHVYVRVHHAIVNWRPKPCGWEAAPDKEDQK